MSNISVIPIRTIPTGVDTREDSNALNRNRKWHIGVSVPIKNPHMKRGKKYVLPLYASGTRGVVVNAGSLELKHELLTALQNALGNNYKFKGQVSNLDRTSVEVGEIVAANDATLTWVYIQLKSRLLYSYLSGNSSFSVTVPTMAEGWHITNEGTTSATNQLMPVSLRKTQTGQANAMIGNLYAQELYIPYGSYNNDTKIFNYAVDTSDMYFPANAQLRVGCAFNVQFQNSSGLPTTERGEIRLSTTGIASTNMDNLNINNFGDSYTVVNSYGLAVPANTDSLAVGISFSNSGANAAVKFWLDQIWVEHDNGTQVGGAIEINDYPIRTSLAMTELDDIEMTRLSSGDYHLHSRYGNASESAKWVIEATYQTLGSIYNYFKIIEDACKQGSLINLHCKVPEVPECLTGKLVVKNVSKNSFAFNRAKFKVLFYEV